MMLIVLYFDNRFKLDLALTFKKPLLVFTFNCLFYWEVYPRLGYYYYWFYDGELLLHVK